MFPEVLWPVHRQSYSLRSDVGVAGRRKRPLSFAFEMGNAEWVNVQTGELDGKMIEGFGDLRDGGSSCGAGTDEFTTERA